MNNNQNQQKTPFRKFHSAILPIDLIEKDANGSVLNKRQIHFQINSGKTYQLSYKFFLPEGCHLSKESKPVVPCKLTDNGLNVKSLKFVYVKDHNSQPQPKSAAAQIHDDGAKPVIVNYLTLGSNHKIKSGRVYGQLGQSVDVIKRIPLPKNYSLCHGQSTTFKISTHFQRVNLLVASKNLASSTSNVTEQSSRSQALQSSKANTSSKPSVSSVSASAVNSSESSESGSIQSSEASQTETSISYSVQSSEAKESSSASSSSIAESSTEAKRSSVSTSSSESTVASQHITTNSEGTPLPFVQDLQAYRNQLAEQLLNLVHQRDFSFLRKVVAMLLNKSGNNDVSNIQSHPDLHEVSGVARNQQNHTTYVRARNYDYSQPVRVSEIRDFCTCILDNHADRGVFITTSSFTKQARQEAKLHSIILIDGSKFAHLMIKDLIGVQVKHVYRSFNIDHEFF